MGLLNAIELWCSEEPYCGFRSATIGWRLLPAEAAGKILHFWDGDRYRGFITWAFLTASEYENLDYCGLEVFSRDSGDRLVFIDMIAKGGASDVLYICRYMRRHFKVVYPKVETVWSHRGSRYGWYPNKGG